ncbi:PspC domain-containing protein [Planomonospora venezuelensis]|uniref:Phage shock protein PspC (Stress-responsive transcriptional regulator) n=1 Tax=Planomonospora venezuelensis TaxID=1999 RepID=A0A841DH45_PLAVE|nr:PspC domain-containing protein [Planomonospora venezuelensis]MBB5967425.1 phage shock protein PspC (stress-responsive transcriptional regulator) [Planomonospora venezuelensis]GIN03958.1 hypothetical protein Pve01_56160 [Planomonospora venezuelensis]
MNENDFSGVKQLRRTRNGRIVAGVASGLGRYIGVDPNIIRAALAVASFFGGFGVAVYAIGWLLLPDEDSDRSIVQDLLEKNKDNPVWLDARAKAERGWREGMAKAEQGWTRATGHSEPYPDHREPAHPPYQNPAPQYTPSVPPQYVTPTSPQGGDEPKPQA